MSQTELHFTILYPIARGSPTAHGWSQNTANAEHSANSGLMLASVCNINSALAQRLSLTESRRHLRGFLDWDANWPTPPISPPSVRPTDHCLLYSLTHSVRGAENLQEPPPPLFILIRPGGLPLLDTYNLWGLFTLGGRGSLMPSLIWVQVCAKPCKYILLNATCMLTGVCLNVIVLIIKIKVICTL